MASCVTVTLINISEGGFTYRWRIAGLSISHGTATGFLVHFHLGVLPWMSIFLNLDNNTCVVNQYVYMASSS